MADAVGLTSAIVTLVETAYSSCQKLYTTFDGVRNAPKHITTISNDLEDFYLVLGTFQALLDDEEFSAGVVQHAQSGNLCNVLKDCLLVFKEFSTIISEYQAHDRNSVIGTWQRLKWTFKESEVKDLRSDLMGCKATLNVAISVANYYNMRATSASTARIEEDMAAHLQELEKLPEILQQIEDLKAAQLPQATLHGAMDRAGIRTDYTFALRHYADSAASIYSDMNTASAPSLQVSALETSSSQLTSRFYTAPMSQTNNGDNRQSSRKCTQVLVRNVGQHKTMAFQVVPEHTIGTIKSLICERIGLGNAEFDLLYSGHVLHSPEKSIDEYGIPHDATLTCISFRPNHSPPNPDSSDFFIDIMVRTGELSRVRFKPRFLVREVKDLYAAQKGYGLAADDICLIYRGEQLEDHRRLFEYGIDHDSVLKYIPGLRASTAPKVDRDIANGTESDPLEVEKTLRVILFPTHAATPHPLKHERTAKKAPSFWKAPLGISWAPKRKRISAPIV